MAAYDPRYGPPDPRYDRPYGTRRPVDPFVAAVSDGVAHGYKAIESVVWGLQESLRLQARPRVTRRPLPPRGSGRRFDPSVQMGPSVRMGPSARIVPGAAPASERGRTAAGHPQNPQRQDQMYGPGAVGYPGGGYAAGGYSPYYDRPIGLGLLDDVTAVFADLLSRAADAAQDVADAITQESHHGAGGGQDCIAELALSAHPGDTANVRFNLWNTGAGALRSVRFDATDLLGADGRIAMKAVSFTPGLVEFVRSRDAAQVVISVAVPDGVVPGVYRGLVRAEPGDDCVVLELTVLPPAPELTPRPPATSPDHEPPQSDAPTKPAPPAPPEAGLAGPDQERQS